MICLQIWLIANALILAWALGAVTVGEVQVEPYLNGEPRRSLPPAGANFT
jgi:hypothetical protein